MAKIEIEVGKFTRSISTTSSRPNQLDLILSMKILFNTVLVSMD